MQFPPTRLHPPTWAPHLPPSKDEPGCCNTLTDVALLSAYISSLEASRDLVCTINRRPNGD
ncbi:hypothetical protein E2C01_070813 [Portunus trituberculatus]|uniref:Uncharacterized protein n=1 Tax=Portunus trituberculatus TaxID=210409 RepID=A0A5B7I2D1_PORTR|nr:hypothetical protein [Portunus trituberculatus]